MEEQEKDKEAPKRRVVQRNKLFDVALRAVKKSAKSAVTLPLLENEISSSTLSEGENAEKHLNESGDTKNSEIDGNKIRTTSRDSYKTHIEHSERETVRHTSKSSDLKKYNNDSSDFKAIQNRRLSNNTFDYSKTRRNTDNSWCDEQERGILKSGPAHYSKTNNHYEKNPKTPEYKKSFSHEDTGSYSSRNDESKRWPSYYSKVENNRHEAYSKHSKCDRSLSYNDDFRSVENIEKNISKESANYRQTNNTNYENSFTYNKENCKYKALNHSNPKFVKEHENIISKSIPPTFSEIDNVNSFAISSKDKIGKDRLILNYDRKIEKKDILSCDKLDLHANQNSGDDENCIVLEAGVCQKREILALENTEFNGKDQLKITIKQTNISESSSKLDTESTLTTPTDKINDDQNENIKLYLEGNFIPPPTEIIQESTKHNFSDLDSPDVSNSSKVTIDSDTLSTNESSFSLHELDPEHLEAITQYILKEVEERSVDTTLADKVLYDLNTVFKVHLEGNVVDLYGSYLTKLAITTSDINIVMKSKADVRKNFMQSVRKVLSNELKGYNVYAFEEADYVTEIKINFAEPKEGISCQLVYLGKRQKNILEMAEYLKFVCSQDKRVKSLIIATKIWAEICQINDVEGGKLHPIGFTLMMIHYLQQSENPVLEIKNSDLNETVKSSDTSIGELWLGFLHYYSSFNWQQNVVTVTSKDCVSKKSLKWENSWMAIQDPYSLKNIARSVVNSDTAEYIKACFKAYYEYFASPTSSSSSSFTDENSSSNENIKYEFSFKDCFIESNDNFCELCDELEETCDECQRKVKICETSLPSIPKMTTSFLKIIRETLYEMHEKYMLTVEEVKEREQFVKELEASVKRLSNYQDVKLKLFGSSVNGFGFKKSDLDICLIFKSGIEQDSSLVLKNLRFFLRGNRKFDQVVAIFGAQIPILKFHYLPKNWRGDISLSNSLAVHNSRLLCTYSMIDERCKILGCCLKLLAKKAIIADTVDKALSSYSYLIMVIHFLQQVEPPVLPVLQDNNLRNNDYNLYIIEDHNIWFCEDLDYIKKVHPQENETPVEQLWLDLLEYYCTFDHNHVISIRQKEPIYIGADQKSARLFNIEDPFIVTKNLGAVVSEKMAAVMINVFHRAWKLFRTPKDDVPSGIQNYEDLFFSTMSLTGRVSKEVHCDSCGKFGHEKKDCKHGKLPFRRRPYRLYPNRYNNHNSRMMHYKSKFKKP